MLLVHQDWGGGQFVAVQWRTELSGGNLTDCYEEVSALHFLFSSQFLTILSLML